ncbi:hypothetical protein ABMA27_009011 [Loxostege sticticalis]|uniref:Reverse transcriptase domain-containing protein n=1 Tax=Loxostege sticticalis TaxID=481309 RepID=A0ABR3H9U1_LOXSC
MHVFTLFHQNIAGILNKNEIFNLTISELSNDIGCIDFICLTETFLKNGSECNLRLPGYKLASHYSRQNQRRGGSCILIKSHLCYTPLQITSQLACPNVFECCGIKLTNYNILIICIYRIPNSDSKVFLEKLSYLLNKINKNNKERVLICGDWNIDVLKDSSQSKELKAILSNYNLYPHVDVPTRKASSIDQIATNMGDSNVKIKIHNLALSDHDMGQSISFTVPKIQNNLKPSKNWFEYRRDYCKENIDRFCECISSLSFSEVYEEHDCNKSFEIFHDLFKLFYDLCFPMIRVRVGKKAQKNKWITKGLKTCCAKKRLLYFRYHNDANNKKHNNMLYTTYTKILKKCIQKSHQINNYKYILTSKNKCKASWDIVKSNIILTNSPKNDIKQIKKNDITYNRPCDIAELFNNFYIDLTCESNINSSTNPINENPIRNVESSMFLTPINEIDVKNIIKSLRNTNSTGYDDINTKILKICADFMSCPLSHIINLSFEQGIFPNRLKTSVIKPIYKKGDPNEMGNYRPITLVPILSKVFEKAMLQRLDSFLSKNNILDQSQFGFRKGSSTTHACFSLVKKITESLNNKEAVVGIFLDMSKAFDFVCHSRLLCKLQHYGIRGKPHEWLQSYLSERNQYTVIAKIINNKMITAQSSSRINDSGVPQGSILGPLLFLLYINDLPQAISHECILFADDTTLVIRCKDQTLLESAASHDLGNVIEWLERNKLKPNVDKTGIIHFRPYNSVDACIKIEHNSTLIKQSNSTMFLGVIIDKNLNWKEHIDRVCIKLDKFVFALRRLRLVASQDTALSAYHGYVSSVLRYGLILWGNSVDMERAFKVQKKCIRALCGAGYIDHCTPLFKQLRILPLPCQYILDICMFIKKNPHLFPLHDTVIEKKNSRDIYKLYIPSQRLKLYSNNVYCHAIKIYNKLPIEVRALSMCKFDYTLTNWLLEKCFYSTKDFLDSVMPPLTI